jgi:hypothetical protein
VTEPLVHLLLHRPLKHEPNTEPSQLTDHLKRVHVQARARKQGVDLLRDLRRRQ